MATITVPAVIEFKLAAVALKLPPTVETPPTSTGWLSLQGRRETVPVPALTEPLKAMSVAVMDMGAFVDESVTPGETVNNAEQQDAVTPFVPEAFALIVMVPEPEVVCKLSVLLVIVLEVVILPLALSDTADAGALMVPVVEILPLVETMLTVPAPLRLMPPAPTVTLPPVNEMVSVVPEMADAPVFSVPATLTVKFCPCMFIALPPE